MNGYIVYMVGTRWVVSHIVTSKSLGWVARDLSCWKLSQIWNVAGWNWLTWFVESIQANKDPCPTSWID